MKKFVWLSFIVLTALSFVSCDKEEVKDAPLGPKEVHLSFGGEFVQVELEPITKASAPRTYYAVNVLSRPSGSEEVYTPCAYGVFDDPSNVKITLVPSLQYKFECTSVKDSGHSLAIVQGTNGPELRNPFCVGSKGYPLSDLNKFVYSSTETLSNIKNGKSTVVSGETDANGIALSTKEPYYPGLARYYGVLTDYTLSGNIAVIEMKSASFGIKLTASEVPDGRVTWTDASGQLDPAGNGLTPEVKECSNIYTINFVSESETKKFPSFQIDIVWTRDNGKQTTTEVIIQPERNKYSTFRVNLSASEKEIGIKLLEKEDFMSGETTYDVNLES